MGFRKFFSKTKTLGYQGFSPTAIDELFSNKKRRKIQSYPRKKLLLRQININQ